MLRTALYWPAQAWVADEAKSNITQAEASNARNVLWIVCVIVGMGAFDRSGVIVGWPSLGDGTTR
jgi:hypothetical protein